ncbi:MAG: MraY family glycosyltransferase [Geminicoccaceae bacterium]
MLAVSIVLYAIFVVAVAWFAQPLAMRFGTIDRPDGIRKMHGRPTPLMGGVALMAPLTCAAAYMAWSSAYGGSIFMLLSATGLLFGLVGFIDDRQTLSPQVRLAVSSAWFVAVFLYEPQLVLLTLDFGPSQLTLNLGGLAMPFTLLCVVGLMNAINMVDGRNGLLIGLSIYWLSMLTMHAPPYLTVYLALFLIGLILLFPFNWFGRLFMGDAGSYSVGVLVGLLAIYIYNEPGSGVTATDILLWLFIPVLDCLRLMANRALHRRSPLEGDTDHLHHRLNQIWPWPQAFWVYMSLAAAPGLLADIMPQLGLAMIPATVVVYSLVLLVTRGPLSAETTAPTRG